VSEPEVICEVPNMNHSFITFKGGVSANKVDALLREINGRRFRGLFVVRNHYNKTWDVRYFISSCPVYFTVYLCNQRKIELRPSIGQFNYWVHSEFQEELAYALKGKCGNEGLTDRWDPETNKYPTFMDYNRDCWKDSGLGTKEMKYLLSLCLKEKYQLREEGLRDFYGRILP